MIPGRIVCSKAGRDKDSFMVVIKVNDKRVYVADGKRRKLDNPKPKNPIHLAKTGTIIDIETMSTNKLLTQALRKFAGQADSREEQ